MDKYDLTGIALSLFLHGERGKAFSFRASVVKKNILSHTLFYIKASTLALGRIMQSSDNPASLISLKP
jgi:hypothetical protein